MSLCQTKTCEFTSTCYHNQDSTFKMDYREDILEKALIENENETNRWETYRTDNENAIKNLDTFGQKLTLEVMVPIGSKALMPGQLYHTNEVFVSHFTGVFSKCSSFDAKKVCNHRISLANAQLEKLNKEKEMFRNQLDIPKIEAMPFGDRQEIIEEYDEENEKRWRQEHQQRVRAHKAKARESKSESENEQNDMMAKLDELELLEELDQELEKLNIKDDETLSKLISGEIMIPVEKKRVSRSHSQSNVIIGNKGSGNNAKQPETTAAVTKQSNEPNNTNLESIKNFTNNNSIRNSSDFQQYSSDSDDSSSQDLPEEFIKLENETQHLSNTDRLKIFKKKIKEIERSISSMKIRNMNDLCKKTELLEAREYFLDYLTILEDDVSQENADSQGYKTHNAATGSNSRKPLKKSISFASENQVKYIDKNSTVDSMFKQEDTDRVDRIVLDPPIDIKNMMQCVPTKDEEIEFDKKSSIIKKVENSFNYTVENQSQSIYNIVDKIIDSQTPISYTRNIKYSHSNNFFTYTGNKETQKGYENSEFVIGSPADIYRIYMSSHEKRISDENSLLLETERTTNDGAYEDPRNVFSRPSKEKAKIKQSILKNKDAVHKESRLKEGRKKSEDENFQFDKIMGDIVENSITEPEPLPEGNFIDAHAPKKRISRFKLMRSN